MGIPQRIAEVQTLMVETPLVKMAATLKPESRKQTPWQTPTERNQWGGSPLK